HRNQACAAQLPETAPRRGFDMANEADITAKFWKALKADRTLMLGLAGADEGHSQPMTAQLDGDSGTIWIFTAKDTAIVRDIGQGHAAVAHFASKGHELFASIEGTITPDNNNRAVIDRLWNTFVAAWFKGGKDDPKLQLLRFEPDHAQ